MRDIKFEQIPLFTGGYSLLTVETRLYFNGPAGTVEVGYEISNTVDDETIELGTLGVVSIHAEPNVLDPMHAALWQRAKADLAPF